MPEGFYVYRLIDPRNGEAFYIGKGKGRRAWRHARAELSGRELNGLKAERLGEIRRAGLTVVVDIEREGLTETEAFALERALIKASAPTLTNISQGCRSPTEVVAASTRASRHEIKPLCAMWKEGADRERMALWVRITSGLVRLQAKAA
ncbi:GIY-YIG nuclease family protein [Caulobacter sp. RHG1]|uniref:GIY-YIG nuclease family protein n=1 Tax=Caulobacter sp. (strain RHG1) TaxID=2545762 RepID=UPI001555A3E7|nr:GIY-YIG nuclease family protein [Caulobacter sp. RHG1]NQE62941.1 hypothetical protein [Caulobacter sp. RHG1]